MGAWLGTPSQTHPQLPAPSDLESLVRFSNLLYFLLLDPCVDLLPNAALPLNVSLLWVFPRIWSPGPNSHSNPTRQLPPLKLPGTHSS